MERVPNIKHAFTFSYYHFLSVDCTSGKLNVLTWRENYAGSSGLSSVKWPTDSMNIRIADGLNVRRLCIFNSFHKASFSQSMCVHMHVQKMKFQGNFSLHYHYVSVLADHVMPSGKVSFRHHSFCVHMHVQ